MCASNGSEVPAIPFFVLPLFPRTDTMDHSGGASCQGSLTRVRVVTQSLGVTLGISPFLSPSKQEQRCVPVTTNLEGYVQEWESIPLPPAVPPNSLF